MWSVETRDVEAGMQCLLCFVLVAYYLCAFYIELECVCLCVHPTYDERLHVISCCKLLKITPVYEDFFDHPLLRLSSRKPIWSDLSPADTSSQWRYEWQSVSVANKNLISERTIRLPGFNLGRSAWSMLNRFHSRQG